nr:Sodium:neurotransmitter symporter domain containing protein [Haemonchus contortus]
MEFLLATIGLTVGLGNVWRFPALAYNNGGSAFLFPYFICAVFFGLPSLYLEMLVGQYMNCGPSMLFRHYLPALQGLGWSMTLISLTVSIYYCVIIAWGFLYLYSAATGQMPKWGSCYNSWNDIYCTDEELMKECARKDPYHPIAFNGSCIAMVFKEMKTPFDQYFTNVVTKRSDGIDQIGDINWPTLTALAVMWTTVILILVKGYEYMGKVAYVTSTVPYVIIVVLFVRGITLEGLSLAFVAYPEAMSKMPYPSVWASCFFAMLFCLGISSEVAFAETICTNIYDQWPYTRKFKWFVSLWFSNIRQDAREMFGEPRDDPLSRLFEPAAPLWAFCWKFVTPAMGLIIMVFTVMRDELTVEHRSKTYTFPGWALGFGWFLSLVPLVPIPIYFVANVIEWKRHGRPLKTLFTIQPSLVSYKRIHGLAEYGILPKDYESSRSSTISSSISSTSSSSIRSDRKTVESAESDR